MEKRCGQCSVAAKARLEPAHKVPALYLLTDLKAAQKHRPTASRSDAEIITVWRTVEPLYGPSTRNQIDNQHNQRDNEQQMDESTAYMTKKSD